MMITKWIRFIVVRAEQYSTVEQKTSLIMFDVQYRYETTMKQVVPIRCGTICVHLYEVEFPVEFFAGTFTVRAVNFDSTNI